MVAVGAYLAVDAVLGWAVDAYTDARPAVFPRTELGPGELDALEARVSAFTAALEGSSVPPSLTLTADEINALLQRHADAGDLVSVSIEGERITGRVSLPLDDLDVPLFARRLRGRYLSGSAGFAVSLEHGVLIVTIQSFEVGGRALPGWVLDQLRRENLVAEVYRDPEQAEKLRELTARFEAIHVRDGTLVVVPRRPAE